MIKSTKIKPHKKHSKHCMGRVKNILFKAACIVKTTPIGILHLICTVIWCLIYGFEWLFWLFGVFLISNLFISCLMGACRANQDFTLRRYCLLGSIFFLCFDAVLFFVGHAVGLI